MRKTGKNSEVAILTQKRYILKAGVPPIILGFPVIRDSTASFLPIIASISEWNTWNQCECNPSWFLLSIFRRLWRFPSYWRAHSPTWEAAGAVDTNNCLTPNIFYSANGLSKQLIFKNHLCRMPTDNWEEEELVWPHFCQIQISLFL